MRVIQDSEDEDDFDLDQVGAVQDASRAADASPQLEEHGTGSTDSLKRRIENEHRLHFQAPSGASAGAQDAPRSSVSLPEHASKRRKTSFDASAAEPPKPNASDNKSEIPTEPLAEKPWEIHGSVQEYWQCQEPEMFVNPSSTIPNATATQQRLLGEAVAPAFLGTDPDPDAPRYEPAKSSIPWSEYLKFTPEQVKSMNQSAARLDQHDAIPQNGLDGSLLLEPSPPIISVSTSSQRSRRESASQQKGSPLRNDPHQSTVDPTRAILPPTLPSGESPFEDNLSGYPMPLIKVATLPDSPRKSPSRLKSCHLPSSEDDLMFIGLTKEQYNPRPSRSRSLKSAPSAIVPENAARKPRRTRTSGAENGTANTTPEKIRSICDMGFAPSPTQRALRQNNGDVASTVDWLIANGISDDDELAPTKTSVSKKKKKKEKPIEKHETSLLTDGSSQRDSMRTDNQGRTASCNTVDKVGNTLLVDDDMAEPDFITAPALPNQPKSPRVSVVIPKKVQTNPFQDDSPHRQPEIPSTTRDLVDASKSQVKRRTMSTKQPESVLEEFVTVETIATESRKEQKKRGRPKREAKSSVTVLETQDRNPSELTETDAALEEIQANDSSIVETVTARREEQMEKTVESAPTISVNDNKTGFTTEISKEASQTPQKLSKSDKSTEISSSHQSKVKTPYRVGLSKRARIAPLLRIVKK